MVTIVETVMEMVTIAVEVTGITGTANTATTGGAVTGGTTTGGVTTVTNATNKYDCMY